MKIVHVINNILTGGAEKLMITVLPELQKLGYELELICLNAWQEKTHAEALAKHGIKVHYLSASLSHYNPYHIFLFYRLIRKINPDIIHVHLFPTLYWVAFSKMIFRYRTPLIMTEHDTSNRRIRSKYWKHIDKLVYAQYEKVICISDGVKMVIDQYMPSAKTVIAYNGIPLDVFKLPPAESKNKNLPPIIKKLRSVPDARIILSVGRLAEKKNQATMIKVFKELPDNYFLLIAGEGALKDELQAQIDSLRLGERVRLLGNQTDIPWLISQADAGILTSTIEGFGLGAAEMMAGGLPVVASDIPGLREVCGDEALLNDPNDHQGFAKILLRLFTDPDWYQQMKLQCMQKADQFSIETMASSYAAIYKTI